MNLSIFSFRTHKVWVAFFVLALLLCLLFLLVFVRFMNPHYIWEDVVSTKLNKTKSSAFFIQHQLKPVAVLNKKPELLIMGTSRAVFGHSDMKSEYSYYNGALGGASMYSNSIWLDYLNKFSSFNRVTLYLDFFSFNEYGENNKEQASFYDVTKISDVGGELPMLVKKINLWSYYFFSAGLVHSLNMAVMNQNHSSLKRSMNYDGSFNYISEVKSNKLWRLNLRGLIDVMLFPENKFCFYNDLGDSTNYKALRKILQSLYKQDTPVNLVISPVHFYYHSALHKVGLEHSFYQWKKDLIGINERVAKEQNKKPYAIWDFAITNQLAMADESAGWFYDPSHMTKNYGEEISRAIRENNTEWQINSSNIANAQKKEKLMFLKAKEAYQGDPIESWLDNYMLKNKKYICDVKEFSYD